MMTRVVVESILPSLQLRVTMSKVTYLFEQNNCTQQVWQLISVAGGSHDTTATLR